VVSTGFESQSSGFSSHLHINNTKGIITGTELEEVMLKRTNSGLFEKTPSGVAFIQCLGSRDQNEGGLYCSRVCCSYSTRAAKVIRGYYPECNITFFYMELQNVEAGNFFEGLRELGMEFIKCRPLKITGGDPVTIEYDDPSGGSASKEFDLVVLSDGIHAGAGNDRLAEVCRLGQDKDGFLHEVDAGSGIYVTGCAKAPMKIDEAHADATEVAGKILTTLGVAIENGKWKMEN
jgi:heterodisulfide reductase subunit A